MSSFFRFVRFCVFLRLPFWHLLAPVVVKNKPDKNIEKVFKNGYAGFTGKTVPGGVGPLKRTENKTIRQPDTDSNTPWRA